MCGIFGSVGEPVDAEAAQRVVAALRHRGPEAHGIEHLPGDVTLVHTRLRIIDLTTAGHQPMHNEDRSVWVTFNGEIYNFEELRRELIAAGHQFRSKSDTEVIVHGYEQWGTDVVRRLDGMFAFGVWDMKRRRLLLARDRSGKKPLFYAQTPRGLSFASEIKALFAAGLSPTVSPDGVAGYLSFGYALAPRTVYAGVSQLLPAHQLILDEGQAPRIEPYWSVDFAQTRTRVSDDEAAAEVRRLMTAAVKRRMVADVPVGAFLSGGLDSSIVVGLMAQLGTKVRTFSIGFSGDPRYDERHFAREVATAFKTDHTEFVVTPGDLQLIETLVWHHDGPFGDSSAIPTYVVSRLTREHVTVALNGDGGDELFAGYSRFWAASTAERVPSILRQAGARLANFIPTSLPSRSLPAQIRRFLSAAQLPLAERMIRWNSFFAFTLRDLLLPDVSAQLEEPDVLAFHKRRFTGEGQATPLALCLNHNFRTYLPYDLLVKMDRTSMAHALETRSPFLDTALIEYVAGLPDRQKLRGRTTKYILRQAFRDLLPASIQTRGKMGFGVPLATWFRADLRSYVMDHLGASNARIFDYVSPQVVGQMLKEHMAGTADHQHHIWALLTMEVWLRKLPAMFGQASRWAA